MKINGKNYLKPKLILKEIKRVRSEIFSPKMSGVNINSFISRKPSHIKIRNAKNYFFPFDISNNKQIFKAMEKNYLKSIPDIKAKLSKLFRKVKVNKNRELCLLKPTYTEICQSQNKQVLKRGNNKFQSNKDINSLGNPEKLSIISKELMIYPNKHVKSRSMPDNISDLSLPKKTSKEKVKEKIIKIQNFEIRFEKKN